MYTPDNEERVPLRDGWRTWGVAKIEFDLADGQAVDTGCTPLARDTYFRIRRGTQL
jgi:hypothetical protein